MTTQALHPDHLQPGHMVGPWRIVQVLGHGGSSRVFKVERDGRPYSMKVALRPLSDSREKLLEEDVEEKSAWRRLAREAAALFTYSSHPNLLRVYAVDFWPAPSMGYPFLVTDYVDGDTWHQWRWRRPLHAAELVVTFSEVVRTLGVLHARGVYHRDLKADNLLIRREDGRPFLIDFGTVRLPGALTQTMGVPEGVLHLLPPELLAYARTEAWKRGEVFHGGVAADLYALGGLLYQALTDLHPFNPELPDEQLVAAIATVPPAAPHLLNPRAPCSLSDIAMKLLEKRPEERYSSTEALLQALEKAAEQERTSPAWKVSLFVVEGHPSVPTSREVDAPPTPPPETEYAPSSAAPPSNEERARQEGATSLAWLSHATSEGLEESPSPNEEPAPREALTAAVRPRRAQWRLVLLGGLSVLCLALWLTRPTLAPPPEALPPGSGRSEKGSLPVSTSPRSTPMSLLSAWLCAVAHTGCLGAQVKPPEPTDCTQEAAEAMLQELKIDGGSPLQAVVDINQPGDVEAGIYQDGPVISRITEGDGNMPEGTLLHGQLWTGPSIYEIWGKEMRPAVMGRYTLAILPNGRKYPVCIVLGDKDGRIAMMKGSKAGAAMLNRSVPVSVVQRWP